ncbi:hypothetical protein JXM67_10270 [candidate division WOR-3 bacterium]|nr:hypothetical protein [candidate division WOR-3 bacterium]
MYGNLLLTSLIWVAFSVNTTQSSEDFPQGSEHYLIAGDYEDLELGGDGVYASSGFGIITLSNDLTVRFHIPTTNYSHKLALHEKRIYLGEADQISVFEINAGEPELVSRFQTPGMVTSIGVNMRFLAAGTDSSKLILFSHADQLEPAASFDLEGIPRDFEFYEGFLYVALEPGGMVVIKLDDVPQRLEGPKTSSAISLAIAEGELYLALSQSKVLVFSIEDPGKPEMKKEFPAGAPIVSLAAYDKHLYAAQGYSGYSVFNLKGDKIEGPESVKYGYAADILPSPEGVYLALREYGILKLEGKNPKALTITDRFIKVQPSLDVSQSGQFWSVAHGIGGVSVLRETGDSMTQGYANPRPVDARGTILSGPYVYVADAERGITIFNLKSFPSANREFDLSQPGEPLRIALDQDLILLAAGSKGLRVLWICSCGPLKQKAAFEDSVYARDVAAADGLFFVADPEAGIRIITDNGGTGKNYKLLQLALFPGSISPQALLLEDSILYVADSVGALITIDVSDPSFPEQLSFSVLGTRPYGLTKMGDVLYVACGEEGLLAVDVKDPTSPIVKQFIQTPGKALSVAHSSTHLGVADYTSFMLIPSDAVGDD